MKDDAKGMVKYALASRCEPADISKLMLWTSLDKGVILMVLDQLKAETKMLGNTRVWWLVSKCRTDEKLEPLLKRVAEVEERVKAETQTAKALNREPRDVDAAIKEIVLVEVPPGPSKAEMAKAKDEHKQRRAQWLQRKRGYQEALQELADCFETTPKKLRKFLVDEDILEEDT